VIGAMIGLTVTATTSAGGVGVASAEEVGPIVEAAPLWLDVVAGEAVCFNCDYRG
jgi:hypothetical protein